MCLCLRQSVVFLVTAIIGCGVGRGQTRKPKSPTANWRKHNPLHGLWKQTFGDTIVKKKGVWSWRVDSCNFQTLHRGSYLAILRIATLAWRDTTQSCTKSTNSTSSWPTHGILLELAVMIWKVASWGTDWQLPKTYQLYLILILYQSIRFKMWMWMKCFGEGKTCMESETVLKSWIEICVW